MFTIETTSDLNALFTDSFGWNALSRGVPFRETAWIAPWWSHHGHGATPFVVTVRDGTGKLRGLLPLYRRVSTGNARTLRIMGDGRVCSDHISVLADPVDLETIAHQVGQYLASITRSPQWGWDLLEVDGFVEGDPALAAFATGLQSRGASLHASSRMSLWCKPTEADWSVHLNGLKKTLRRKVRRYIEQVGDFAPFQVRVAQTHAETTESIDTLIRLHQQRWNDVGEAGSFATDSDCAFIRSVAQNFLVRGQLYLAALQHDSETVAVEFNLIGTNRILYVYSSGFDTSRGKLEPGRILSAHTLRHVYSDSLAGIDYLRGDEEYKKRYKTESHRVILLRAVPPTWIPRLRDVAWRTGFEVKQWVRQRTGRAPIAVVDPISSHATSPSPAPIALPGIKQD